MSELGRDVISRTEAQVIGSSPVERTAAGQALGPEQELMTINMGPHHPATHGVLRLLVSLEGEVVRDLKPVVGYVHTGIEKNCEDKSYWKVIPFVERMDYLSYFFNMEAFVGCVERLLELEIPPRAKYLRVIHLELNRIHSHLVWLGTGALDLGAMSMFFYCFRDRDRILDLFEMSTGQRMHTRYFQVGGVFEDIPVGFERKARAFCAEMPSRIDQYEAILNRNEIFLRRTRNVGVVLAPATAGPGGHGAAAAGRRRAVGSAQGRAHPRLRGLRLPDPGRNRGRRLRPLPRPGAGDARVGADRRAGPRRAPRGPMDRRRSQGGAAAARRALDLDGGLDPPLQAGHRGLPGAAGRGLLPGRGAARRARLLRGRGWLGEARPGPHPRPLVREPAGASRHVPGRLRRRPDPEPGDARPDPGRHRPDESRDARFPSCTRSTSRTSCGKRSRRRCRVTRRSAPPRFPRSGPSSAPTGGAPRRASVKRRR